MSKVKAFINYHSISVLLAAALEKAQKDLGWDKVLQPVKDVKTKDLFELKEPITKVLEDAEWRDKIKLQGRVVKFSSHEWKVLENLVKVLEPFKEATLELSKASACISLTIPTVTSLLHTLNPSCSDSDGGVKDLKSRLKSNLEARVELYETKDIYSIATLLDPKFKEHFFRSDESRARAKQKLINLVEAEASIEAISDDQDPIEEVTESNNNQTGLVAVFQALKNNARKNDGAGPKKETAADIVNNYLEEKLEEYKTLSWWSNFEQNSKESKVRLALCRVAKKYLTPCPTSTNCERLFSVAGQIMDEKRSTMLPENLERILFLRENVIVTNFSLDW